MTATKPPPAPSQYQSGFCSVRAHERCRGEYAGCACTCGCHQEPAEEPADELPPPEVLGEIAAALTEVAIAAAVELPTRHCPTCHCGDPTT